MKNMIKRVIPVTLAVSLAATPVLAYAAEEKLGPGKPYPTDVMVKLEDNVMEYHEIEMLIDTYNTSLKNLRESYADSKHAMEDIEAVKEQIEDGSDQLSDAADQLAALAKSMESMIGYEIPAMGVSVVPSAYAELVYNSVVLENQSHQLLLSADQLTEMTPEMMRIQMVDSPRAMMIGGAQSLLIAYENICLQKGSLLDAIALAEAGVQTTERLAAVGMGTAADVNSAKQGLSASKAGLITLEANEVNIRQQLCNMLGWAYDASPEIPAIPSVDLTRVDAINLETDTQTAINNNFTLKYNRLSEDTLTNGSVQMENLLRTMKAQEAEIATSMAKLYSAVLQARNEYFNAQTTYGIEQVNMAAAERKFGLGMLSKMEYLQVQNTYKSAGTNVRVAELTLLQAIETYDWAVKGSLTVSQ